MDSTLQLCRKTAQGSDIVKVFLSAVLCHLFVNAFGLYYSGEVYRKGKDTGLTWVSHIKQFKLKKATKVLRLLCFSSPVLRVHTAL